MSTRRVFALGCVIVMFGCITAHVDQRQVVTQAALALDCDESIVKIESEFGSSRNTARYDVRGCGRTADLSCVEHAGHVSCRRASGRETASAQPPAASYDDDTAPVAGEGCGCGSLFAGRPDPAQSPSSPNVMPTTPARNK